LDLRKRERHQAFVESKKMAAALQDRMRPHILSAETEPRRAEELEAVRTAVEDRALPFFFRARPEPERLYRRA